MGTIEELLKITVRALEAKINEAKTGVEKIHLIAAQISVEEAITEIEKSKK